MVDFGDDRLTRGRPHPMIDGSLRVERLLAEVADPTTGVLLLDVVLGLGAGRRPRRPSWSRRPAPRTRRRRAGRGVGGRHPRRPAGPPAQVAALTGAGAWVYLSNAAAARCALDLLTGSAA